MLIENLTSIALQWFDEPSLECLWMSVGTWRYREEDDIGCYHRCQYLDPKTVRFLLIFLACYLPTLPWMMEGNRLHRCHHLASTTQAWNVDPILENFGHHIESDVVKHYNRQVVIWLEKIPLREQQYFHQEQRQLIVPVKSGLLEVLKMNTQRCKWLESSFRLAFATYFNLELTFAIFHYWQWQILEQIAFLDLFPFLNIHKNVGVVLHVNDIGEKRGVRSWVTAGVY